jgi:Spx/MgsR family transcriptional regulator
MLIPTCLATEQTQTQASALKLLSPAHFNFGALFMPKAKIKLLQKPTCTTCRKAKAYLEKLGADIESRSLDKERLSKSELEEIIGDRDYTQFLSTRNELYRAKNMKEHPPTRAQAIALMAENPNLIRRPLVMRGHRLVIGYDEQAYKEIVK